MQVPLWAPAADTPRLNRVLGFTWARVHDGGGGGSGPQLTLTARVGQRAGSRVRRGPTWGRGEGHSVHAGVARVRRLHVGLRLRLRMCLGLRLRLRVGLRLRAHGLHVTGRQRGAAGV